MRRCMPCHVIWSRREAIYRRCLRCGRRLLRHAVQHAQYAALQGMVPRHDAAPPVSSTAVSAPRCIMLSPLAAGQFLLASTSMQGLGAERVMSSSRDADRRRDAAKVYKRVSPWVDAHTPAAPTPSKPCNTHAHPLSLSPRNPNPDPLEAALTPHKAPLHPLVQQPLFPATSDGWLERTGVLSKPPSGSMSALVEPFDML